PALSDRDPEWPSHPRAARDSLHEADMWAVEGLTHRYPTKVLAEILPTCPQYCGHCTRMDLVGNSTPQVAKYKFEVKQPDRLQLMLEYLRRTPSVRDVVVSGGDVANMPITRLEEFVYGLMDIPNISDSRLATKELLELCFTLEDRCRILPYYFYMCDMIPNSEHWRIAVWEAQQLQHAIMGYLPGFATPRIVCDVPMVGKRWVHQVEDYDLEKGISYWSKNYRTGIEYDDA